ncbi:MAG: hypothetical protein HY364_02920 [Candidatus Aenigmarchaeota archaeon]|nr:hypothetical protein [Candidatus Aenigmarchaeota archaeon]
MPELYVIPPNPESEACWASIETNGPICELAVYNPLDLLVQRASARYDSKGYILADGGRIIYDLANRRLLCADSYEGAKDVIYYVQDMGGTPYIAGIKTWTLPYTHAAIGPVEALEILEEAKKRRTAPVDELDLFENTATESAHHPAVLLQCLKSYDIKLPEINAGETDPITDLQFASLIRDARRASGLHGHDSRK